MNLRSFHIFRSLSLLLVVTSLVLAGVAAILTRWAYDDVLPSAGAGLWRLEYRLSFDAQREGARLQIGLPQDSPHVRIFRQMMNHPALIPEVSNLGIYQSRLDLMAEEPGDHSVAATFEFEIAPEARNTGRLTAPAPGVTDRGEINRWLRSTRTIQANSEVVRQLVHDWKQESTAPAQLVRRAFEFCRQELEHGDEAWQEDAEGTLTDRMGTELGCLKAMVALCRAALIGARLASGFEIAEEGETTPMLWVEVWLDGVWIPFSPIHGFSGTLPWNWVKVGSDSELVVSVVGGRGLESGFFLTRLPAQSRLSAGNRHWSSVFDLTRLPRSIHEVLKLMLLLPLGAVVTTLIHVVIGWRTVGVFTPALIALSFILADWRTGVVVFFLAISLGMVTRSLVEPLRLLMVARLSFMLTAVVVFLVLMVSCLDYFRWTPSADAVLLPIVILTLTIEKMYSSMVEEGPRKTAMLLLSTIVVSACCYLILGWNWIGEWVLQFPEIHCFTLALLIVLGRYTGYRVTELVRFRDLVSVQVREPK